MRSPEPQNPNNFESRRKDTTESPDTGGSQAGSLGSEAENAVHRADPKGEVAAVPKGSVLAWAKFSVPAHAMLPVAIWGFGRVFPDWLNTGFLVLHVLGLVLIVFSYPYWRGRSDELAGLLLLNHLTTFAVGIGLLIWLAES